MSYAKGTTVDVGRTQMEIEKLLQRAGAREFVRGWSDDRAALAFLLDERRIRIELPLPDPDDPDVVLTPTGRMRSESARQEAYEAEARRRWRALLAVLKAKLVAIDDGISTIEKEFLAFVELPDGRTVGDWVEPQLSQVYAGNTMPALLPGAD